MASAEHGSNLVNCDTEKLRTRFDELQLGEVLDIEGTFTARDIDRDRYETKGILRVLRNYSAVDVVGQTVVEDACPSSTSRVNEYRWKSGVVENLREYEQTRDELPCGCRAHVHHNDDGTFGCKYCDDDPEFDRGRVEEVVFG